MTDAPPHQTITLNDPSVCAVFVDATDDSPARVFYDLDAIFMQFGPGAVAASVSAMATNDPHQLGFAEGAVTVLESLRKSREALLLERAANSF